MNCGGISRGRGRRREEGNRPNGEGMRGEREDWLYMSRGRWHLGGLVPKQEWRRDKVLFPFRPGRGESLLFLFLIFFDLFPPSLFRCRERRGKSCQGFVNDSAFTCVTMDPIFAVASCYGITMDLPRCVPFWNKRGHDDESSTVRPDLERARERQSVFVAASHYGTNDDESPSLCPILEQARAMSLRLCVPFPNGRRCIFVAASRFGTSAGILDAS